MTNYETIINYDSHYDEHGAHELQRHANDHDREPVLPERRHLRRHSNQDHRDVRRLEKTQFLILNF